MLGPLRLKPVLKERVWGGKRLHPDGEPGIGEAWLIHDANTIADGAHAGSTLADVTAAFGERLIGRRGRAAAGGRFPLLIKLLDATEWLSVQVHPDDEQARRLEGPDQCGKTEAWHILDADDGARVLAGLRPGTRREDLAGAIAEGTVLELATHIDVAAGDTVFNPAGLVHALGPGVLLYEIQQSSDITYRVWDWNRPASAGRSLHVQQSLAVARLDAVAGVLRAADPPATGRASVAECAYFVLERLGPGSVELRPGGESFHALTVIEGAAKVAGVDVRPFESVVIPADSPAYRVEGVAYRALLARVP